MKINIKTLALISFLIGCTTLAYNGWSFPENLLYGISAIILIVSAFLFIPHKVSDTNLKHHKANQKYIKFDFLLLTTLLFFLFGFGYFWCAAAWFLFSLALRLESCLIKKNILSEIS